MRWNDKVDRICERCDKPFTVFAYRLKHDPCRFCSRECSSANSREYITSEMRMNGIEALRQCNQRKALSIERACQQCERRFLTPAWKIRQGKGKFCSVKCFNEFQTGKPSLASTEKLSQAIKASYQQNPERAISNSRIMKALWQDPEFRQKTLESRKTPEAMRKQSEGNSRVSKQMWQNPQIRAKIIEGHKPMFQDPAYKAQSSKRFKLLWQNPEFKARMSEIHRRQWLDPEYREKVVTSIIKGLKRKPTRPEQKLIDILNKHLPEFKYNGDFSLGITLGSLIPDFVNVNGKKQVIEVLGDYFHSPELLGNRWQGSELGKVMIYNSIGWKCLTIWEHELNQLGEDEILKKVKSFSNRK